MTTVINLFAGPGAGKSTTAADLYAHMKWQNIEVELIDEYAKQLSWEKRASTLEDQLYVMASQNRKLTRLNDQVKYVITDSPLIMGLPYCKPDYYPESFPKLVWDVWNSYDNINVFLNRVKPFHPVGRHHNEEESNELDKTIKLMLYENKVEFTCVDADDGAKSKIFDYTRATEQHWLMTNHKPGIYTYE